jgi:hypothetical protein
MLEPQRFKGNGGEDSDQIYIPDRFTEKNVTDSPPGKPDQTVGIGLKQLFQKAADGLRIRRPILLSMH